VTPRQLADTLARYGAALGAELELLRHVQRLSADQHDAATQQDSERLHHVASERVRLMDGLVRIEEEIRTDRMILADHRVEAADLRGFHEVTELHRIAAALVADIAATDQHTMTALEQAEVARRTTAQAIETGETTLNAYRRVLAPSAHGPALVDRRG
jgi:hypothetical protein